MTRRRIIFGILAMLTVCSSVTAQDEPGEQPFVDKITIEGNEHISGSAIRNTMFTKTSHWWNRSRLEMELFKDDLRSITTLYNNRGFLEAVIAGWDTSYVEKNRVRITINIDEGPQSIVGEITFKGNQVYSDDRLREELQIESGKAFSFLRLSRSTWNIINAYADGGYLEAQAEPQVQTTDHVIDLAFNITEGNPIYADSVLITGNEKTKDFVVKREIRIDNGDLLTHSKIIQSQRNLYKTGIFNSVSISPARDSVGNNYRNVYVRLSEAETGEFNFGLGYGSKELFRGTAELLQSNLRGTGQRIGLRGKASFAELRGEVLYTAPFFILWGVRLDNTVYARRQGEPDFINPDYVLNRLGIESTIGREIFTYSRISSSLKFENNFFSEMNIPATEETDTANTRIRSINLTYTRDSRKNLFNSSSGSFFSLSGLIAGSIFEGTNSFLRLTGDYARYYPARPWLTLAMNLSTGVMYEIGETQSIPIYERFYAGGDQSVRGYSEKSLSPMRNGTPIGGNFKTVVRFETRFKVYKGLHLALFSDTGNTWRRVELQNLREMRTGVGLGLRYETPIGVARVDYGVKVNRQARESVGQIHITLGQAF